MIFLKKYFDKDIFKLCCSLVLSLNFFHKYVANVMSYFEMKTPSFRELIKMLISTAFEGIQLTVWMLLSC